jgi:hypothetical protein
MLKAEKVKHGNTYWRLRDTRELLREESARADSSDKQADRYKTQLLELGGSNYESRLDQFKTQLSDTAARLRESEIREHQKNLTTEVLQIRLDAVAIGSSINTSS